MKVAPALSDLDDQSTTQEFPIVTAVVINAVYDPSHCTFGMFPICLINNIFEWPSTCRASIKYAFKRNCWNKYRGLGGDCFFCTELGMYMHHCLHTCAQACCPFICSQIKCVQHINKCKLHDSHSCLLQRSFVTLLSALPVKNSTAMHASRDGMKLLRLPESRPHLRQRCVWCLSTGETSITTLRPVLGHYWAFQNWHLCLIGFGNCARPPDVDGCLYLRNVIKSAILLDGDPFWAEIEFSGLGPHALFFSQWFHFADVICFALMKCMLGYVSCWPWEMEMNAIEWQDSWIYEYYVPSTVLSLCRLAVDSLHSKTVSVWVFYIRSHGKITAS